MLGDQMKFQVVPDDVRKTWNEHVLRGLILVSVTLQINLLLLGKLRKYNPRNLIKFTLWCVYSLAYAIVPVALSITVQGVSEACNHSHPVSKYHKPNKTELMSFWAQFLILHLGGPETITAYSLEDNNIWLRHLLFLLIQSGVALYLLLLSLPGCSHLPLLSIFVYVAGGIKCFERIQALRLADTKHLREAMLGPADPGPDYVKFLEEFLLKRSQGFIVKVEEVAEPPLPTINHAYSQRSGREVHEAYNLFQTFKRLFVGLILTYQDRDRSTSYFRHLDSSQAFHAVEIELGFIYDMLYTKTSVVYSNKGLVRRATCVLLILLVLVGFHFHSHIDQYLVIDIAITYMVIAAEFLKEIIAVITMLRSDWTDLCLKQENHTRNNLIFPFLRQPGKQRWSNSIGQLDLLNDALEEQPACFSSKKLFRVKKYLKKKCYEKYSEVSFNMKDMIYSQFKFMSSCSDPKEFCIYKGSYSLKKNELGALLWSINEVEFHQSVLIWHVATALCYYSETNDQFEANRIESKHISEYLVHLLISTPEMLPVGIGMISYRDTCADAVRFFKMKRPITEISVACRKLLEVSCEELSPRIVKGDQSKSVLFDGCILALALKKMKCRKTMWKVMSEVWIEILAYAAAQCRVLNHSQQLGRGGEFLTHVWLLMAHFGMTEHFQVSHGHARARFNVS
ncbi:hypothetical protein L2E82_36460 [Cichorium intybus]|uniref:Uncharacterized protein n=1 Tax=Cichorium intybus TaxID=13427 RepID=A0ACB9BRT7_CICIN|nr:hypothetical protein L2E82_36460 [Cichorium intybus]